MMDKDKLLQEWLEEERLAHIKGWDFSHIHGRYEEEDQLPWDLKETILTYLKSDMKLLDMETGGGEFLLSLGHPVQNTTAIEAYPPNVAYCKEMLLPLGIHFIEADAEQDLPFEDESFNVITNRHGSYIASEVKRMLDDKGYFITQQVGANNDSELIQLLVPEVKEIAFPKQHLSIKVKELEACGFEILEQDEVFRPIRFYDVGALVWFAKIIEWEFKGFSVKSHLDNLYRAQEILEEKGFIEGTIHRFYIVAKKKIGF